MSKAKLLVAACAMVLGVSEIGAMVQPQRPQMTQQNHDNMVQGYIQRLEADFKRGTSWHETMDEARNNGVLDEVLMHEYSKGSNALGHAIACGVNFASNPWDVWGSPAIRATLLTEKISPSMSSCPVDLALIEGYDNNTIFQLLRRLEFWTTFY